MTLPLDALRAVRRIIVHAQTATSPCPDGRASALILHAALPAAAVCEMAYGSPEHNALIAEPGLLFCDFTPPKGRLAEFAAAGTIVLDHHERSLVEPFGDRGIFGENEKDESGAWLAWREVYCLARCSRIVHPFPHGCEAKGSTTRSRAWPHDVSEARNAEKIAALAAIRDTWSKESDAWEESCALAEVLRLVPLDDLLAMGLARVVDLTKDVGPALLRVKRANVAEAAANAVFYQVRSDLRAAVIPSISLTSDVADLLVDKADVVAGFEHVHEGGRARIQWSLRSRGTVDVQRIAKHFGGGGHKAAAGFSVPVDLAPMAHVIGPCQFIHSVLRDIVLVPPRKEP